MTQRIHQHASAILAVALTTLALTILALTSAVPASARTFDLTSTGSIVQQPLRPGFACVMRRAMLDRSIPCPGIDRPGDGVGAAVPGAPRHGGLW
jgi:hypothetical protein